MVQYSYYTNMGSRSINEDSYGAAVGKDAYCFVVADGLGGHGGGEIASRLAVETVCTLFLTDGWSDSFFEKAFNEAQQQILAEQERQMAPSKMKTTIVVLVIYKKHAYIAHTGDSRVYCFRKSKIKTRTIDHSVPQMLALSGDIKETEIRHHPDRNRVTKVLGLRGQPAEYEISEPIRLRGDVSFLLCTDGFWELIEDEQMENTLSQTGDPEEWLCEQAKIVQQNGIGTDMDNNTCIAVCSHTSGLFG